jgi:hypothetical protein
MVGQVSVILMPEIPILINLHRNPPTPQATRILGFWMLIVELHLQRQEIKLLREY